MREIWTDSREIGVASRHLRESMPPVARTCRRFIGKARLARNIHADVVLPRHSVAVGGRHQHFDQAGPELNLGTLTIR